jgi:hypothetical protein
MGNAVRLLSEDLDALAQPRGEPTDSNKNTTLDTTEQRPQDPSADTCLMCGAKELIDGRLQSTGVVQFRPEKTKFWAWEESNVTLKAKMCNACGFIHQFADTDKMERLHPNKED